MHNLVFFFRFFPCKIPFFKTIPWYCWFPKMLKIRKNCPAWTGVVSHLLPSLLGLPYVTGQWEDPASARGAPAGQFHTQVTLISVGRFHPAGIAGCSLVYKFREIVHAALRSISFFVSSFCCHPFLCSSKSFISNALFQVGSDIVLVDGGFFAISISPLF